MNTISRFQLDLLIFCALLAPSAELLPALVLPRAGRSAFLAVFLGGLPVLLWRGLWSEGFRSNVAPIPAGRAHHGSEVIYLIIYIAWFQLLLTLRLALCTRRLMAGGARDGGLMFFLGVITLLLWRVNRLSLSAFARAGQLFLAVLLLAGGAVLVLSLPQCDAGRLTPVSLPPLSPVLQTAGLLGWSMPALVLPVNETRRGRPWLRRWTALFLLSLTQAVILANLGVGLAARMDAPFFALAKGVGVEGAFQRIESLIASLWLLADLTVGGVILFGQRTLLAPLTDHRKGAEEVLLLLAAVGAVMLLGAPRLLAGLVRKLLPAGNLLLGAALPLFVRMSKGTKTG